MFCFLQIWLGFFSISLTNGLMSNYSKTFGLTFINDDHFFAKVAVFLNILNGICRILWGYYYDRFGFKHCFRIIGVTVTLVTATLPALPALGKYQAKPRYRSCHIGQVHHKGRR